MNFQIISILSSNLTNGTNITHQETQHQPIDHTTTSGFGYDVLYIMIALNICLCFGWGFKIYQDRQKCTNDNESDSEDENENEDEEEEEEDGHFQCYQTYRIQSSPMKIQGKSYSHSQRSYSDSELCYDYA